VDFAFIKIIRLGGRVLMVNNTSVIRKFLNTSRRVLLALMVLLVVAVLVSALSNLGLPQESRVVERLDEVEKARLAEIIHIRKSVGDQIWPGWGEVDIPLLVYNEAYAFLVGFPEPAAGWFKVPGGPQSGGPWELVPGDDFYGQAYYRQPLPDSDTTPEAFTVKVGDRWVASLQTKEWMEIALRNTIQGDLPAFLQPVVPYRLVVSLLLKGSDGYIAGLLHESFHAFQGMTADGRLEAAEVSSARQSERYPSQSNAFQAAWQNELDLLAEALQAETQIDQASLAAQFLAQRDARRKEAAISPALQEYERHREWLEGLARYAELGVWQAGATSPAYQPLPEAGKISDFDAFATHERRWRDEVSQLRRMAGSSGDGRFYYSGMAQAMLLDELLPDWKEQILQEGVFLEDLLRASVLAQ
jgi:hypothetical protein